MYYGKYTPELEELEKKYIDMFGVTPFGHMQLEYAEDDYDDYVRDIKKALAIKKVLPEFVK